MPLAMSRPYQHPKTGVYWVRKIVPKELRPLVGKGELKKSLKTKDPTEARRLAPSVIAAFEQRIARAPARNGIQLPLRAGEQTRRAALARRSQVPWDSAGIDHPHPAAAHDGRVDRPPRGGAVGARPVAAPATRSGALRHVL